MWQKIRKFGLCYCDLPTLIENVTLLLRQIGLNVDPRNEKPVSTVSLVWLVINIISYYYVYLVSMAWFVFWRCRETGDKLRAIVIFSFGVTSQISMTKLLCMFAQRKSLKKVIAAYLSFDALVEQDTRFARQLLATLRTVKKRVILLWVVIMWNGLIYVLIPLFKSGKHLMDDEFIFLGLEPMKESPNFEIAYTINSICVFAACYPGATITAFFIILAGYYEAQMLALSNELTLIWEDALLITGYNIDNLKNKKAERRINIFLKSRLESIVRGHTINLCLIRKIESIFRGAVALEFLFLIIGIIAALLGGLENTYIELPFALMSAGTDCFTGQKITDASKMFERAIYDSKWENFDVENRKTVLLMLQNSQRVVRLSAGGIATLSLECFMIVIRTTYKAYTTLLSTI